MLNGKAARFRACVALLALATPSRQVAGQGSPFCAGFADGFKSEKGGLALVPLCPIEPLTPIGSTPYREGFDAGVRRARVTEGPASVGSRGQPPGHGFCEGFEDGFRSEKGAYAVVPFCPIEPLTPLGSSPYREGYVAGMRRGRAADGVSPQSVGGSRSSDEFCEGFFEGWRARKGEGQLAPICPVQPLTPLGSSSYREGIAAGLRAAERSGRSPSADGGGSSGDVQGEFCDGFAVGWKAIKRDYSAVPICPAVPIVPVGSTPYREGLKAGFERAKRP